MAESTTDDAVQVQDKVDDKRESNRKNCPKRIININEWITLKVAKEDEVNKKLESKYNDPFFEAVGVRPKDLAKHGQSFYIHCRVPNCYLKYSTSFFNYGNIVTQKSHVGDATLFALEDAGSGSYYIKARNQDDNKDVGYLYLSDKKSGMPGFRLNNIMWSQDRQDEPNFKFKFQEDPAIYANWVIRCMDMYLIATANFNRYLMARTKFPRRSEGGYFELNMPNLKDMKIEVPPEGCFNLTNLDDMQEVFFDVNGELCTGQSGQMIERQISDPTGSPSEEDVDHTVDSGNSAACAPDNDLHQSVESSTVQPTASRTRWSVHLAVPSLGIPASIAREHPGLDLKEFKPQESSYRYYYIAKGAVMLQQLSITLNQKEFVGWKLMIDDPGSLLKVYKYNVCKLLSREHLA